MTATLYSLNRHRDISGVSGEGDDIATICEFPSGLTVMHWNSDTPTVEILTDLRHVTKLHAHEGASTLSIHEPRLVTAYTRVMPYVVNAQPHHRPIMVSPHPDHTDRLRLVLKDEQTWRFWIGLLDGSSDATTHVEVNGEMEHTWISSDGNVWLVWYSLIGTDPLQTFDREDRG